jgi:hypothetical protein
MKTLEHFKETTRKEWLALLLEELAELVHRINGLPEPGFMDFKRWSLQILANMAKEIQDNCPSLVDPLVYVDKITSIDPPSACSREKVSIGGYGLDTTPPASPVLLIPSLIWIDRNDKNIDSWSDNQIRFTVPENASKGCIAILDGTLYNEWIRFVHVLKGQYLEPLIDRARQENCLLQIGLAEPPLGKPINLGQLLDNPPLAVRPACTGRNLFEGTVPFIADFSVAGSSDYFVHTGSGHLFHPGDWLKFEWKVERADTVTLDRIKTTAGSNIRDTVCPMPSILIAEDYLERSFYLHLPLDCEDDYRFELIAANRCGIATSVLNIQVRIQTIRVWELNLHGLVGAGGEPDIGKWLKDMGTRLRNIAQLVACNDNDRAEKARSEGHADWKDSAGVLFGLTECRYSEKGCRVKTSHAEPVQCPESGIEAFTDQCFHYHWFKELEPELSIPLFGYASKQLGENAVIGIGGMFTQEGDFLNEKVGPAHWGEKQCMIIGARFRIRGTNFILPFYATHLPPDRDQDDCCEDINSIVRETRRTGDLPPIVVGDFNFSRQADVPWGAGKTFVYSPDAWKEMNRHFSCIHKFTGRVDHIWVGRYSKHADAPAALISRPEDPHTEFDDGGETLTDHNGTYSGLRLARPVSYTVWITTGEDAGAGTGADVYIAFHGSEGWSEDFHLEKMWNVEFRRGSRDRFDNVTVGHIGRLLGVLVRFEVSAVEGSSESKWFLSKIELLDNATGEQWTFNCNRLMYSSTGKDSGKTSIKEFSVE